MKNNTCVYLYTRSDGVVFYVGIGSLKRPYSEWGRNPHWHNTTNRHAYTVSVIHENLSWEAACALEIQLIAKYRQISGDKLCNITIGGEGTRGSTHNLGRKHSERTREKLSLVRRGNQYRLGTKQSDETRAKISEWGKTRVFSEEHRLKISSAKKGCVVSEETRLKLSASKKGKSQPPELVAKRVAANTGKKRSAETRAKLSAATAAYWVGVKSQKEVH